MEILAYVLLYILLGVILFNIKLNLGHFDNYNVFESSEEEEDLKRFIDEGIIDEMQQMGLTLTAIINILFWPIVLVMTIFNHKNR